MVTEAIKQCIVHCRIMEETQYDFISLRGCLYLLGYTEEEADEVIRYCASRGFTRAIDPMIESTYFSPDDPKAVDSMVTEYPSVDDCHWGCDQLRSRLESCI